jgi:hypothetical protein
MKSCIAVSTQARRLCRRAVISSDRMGDATAPALTMVIASCDPCPAVPSDRETTGATSSRQTSRSQIHRTVPHNNFFNCQVGSIRTLCICTAPNPANSIHRLSSAFVRYIIPVIYGRVFCPYRNRVAAPRTKPMTAINMSFQIFSHQRSSRKSLHRTRRLSSMGP